jgi:transposase
LQEISLIPPSNLVFIDESGVCLGMTRTHARSPKNERAYCTRSAASQSNISLVGAITVQGICDIYPYDGPIDGERFLAFLNRLIPKLNSSQVVVMDNLRVHHIQAVKDLFHTSGIRLLYLPPYSPERNPIEEAWSLMKRVLRTLQAKTIPTLLDALKTASEAVTQTTAENLFKHAGYAL